MDDRQIQSKLMGLAAQEQTLRERALAAVAANDDLILHLGVTEAAMDLIVLLQQSPRDAGDQDKAALTLLSMRLFNSLGSSLTLMLTGYYQSSAMVLRDVLETIFLLDYLLTDPARVSRWRSCTPKERDREFKQVNIRTELDARDGFTSMKRAEQYKMFCSLASHPTPDGFAMLRPKDMGAVVGPFFDASALQATASEMGKLAVQVGGHVASQLPKGWRPGLEPRAAMLALSQQWLARFYAQ